MPTCNRFDTTLTQENIDSIHSLYNEFLAPIIGPLVGHASDGDSILAQRLPFIRVRDCLQCLIDGNEDRMKDESVKGVFLYFELIWYYVEICCSPVASLADRINYAAVVSCFGFGRISCQGLTSTSSQEKLLKMFYFLLVLLYL